LAGRAHALWMFLFAVVVPGYPGCSGMDMPGHFACFSRGKRHIRQAIPETRTVCSMPFPERTLHPLPGCRSASRQSWLFASYGKHGVQSFKFVQDISRPSSHAALALKCGTCGTFWKMLQPDGLCVKHEPSACCTYEFVGPILKRMLTKRKF